MAAPVEEVTAPVEEEVIAPVAEVIAPVEEEVAAPVEEVMPRWQRRLPQPKKCLLRWRKRQPR